MTKKITPEQYRQWLSENNPTVSAIGDYEDDKTKIPHRCSVDGAEWETRPGNVKAAVRRGHTGCPACKNRGIKALKNLGHQGWVEWLAENRPDMTVVDQYIDTDTPITHRCSEGHEYTATPSNVKYGKGNCAHCEGSFIPTPKGYRDWIAENRPDIASVDDYAGSQTPLTHRCRFGHEWESKPAALKSQGSGCPTCSGRVPQPYREWLAENRPEIEAVEGYINSNTKIAHRCPEGHEWLAKPSNIKSGRGCPKCQQGSDFDRVYCWIVTEAPDDVVVPLDGHHLVKAGVTSQRVDYDRPKQTARANGMGCEVIAICDTSEGDALYFEEVIHSLGTDAGVPYWYQGYTEFRLVSDAELGEIMALLGADEQAAMAA